jgi:hypothetical protein
MKSRERVLMALQGGQPDRVPFVDSMDRGMQVQVMGRQDFDQQDLAETMAMDALALTLSPPLFVERKVLPSGINYISEPGIWTREDLNL